MSNTLKILSYAFSAVVLMSSYSYVKAKIDNPQTSYNTEEITLNLENLTQYEIDN